MAKQPECALELRRAKKHYPRPCQLCKGGPCLKPFDKAIQGARNRVKGFGFWMAKPSTRLPRIKKERTIDSVLPDSDTDIIGGADAGTGQRKRRGGAE